ncbi:DUF6416 domain-containing protein [Saccharomonospora iraqiensis]|uniref:DUF6416 domain-containing protein n=1 Tax=Saccharomonospora iraqiensis TaxID=52698 RepID=UPI00047D3C59|nr:DUF6416 domain-containing protein [Saccharomonospora iraqiensis]
MFADDDPVWEQHSGGRGHRDRPEWQCPDDLALAEAFYGTVRGRAKVFLDVLIDHPGMLLGVTDLHHLTGDDAFGTRRSVAGVVSGLHRAHRDSGRRYPFHWWGGDFVCYGMKPGVAELFRRAREGGAA